MEDSFISISTKNSNDLAKFIDFQKAFRIEVFHNKYKEVNFIPGFEK